MEISKGKCLLKIVLIVVSLLAYVEATSNRESLYASPLPPFVESKKRKFLAESKKIFPESSSELKGVEFLIDHVSTVDLINIAPEDLINHVRYSFKARDLMPWGKSVPESIFFEYVLFHKAAQEPFEPYKPLLFSKLAPLVYDSKSIREAALIINRWIGGQVLFRPSSAWDIGPLELLRRGFGRCEELGILLVSALRSVAIPARIAWIPAWRHVDGNHAWVEVYLDDGKWHFLDAGSPQQDFDRPWFAPFLSQVPAVWVASPDNSSCSESVVHGRAFLCNETESYTETETVNVHIKHSPANPSGKFSVSLLIWNSGRLRPVIASKTNGSETVRFKIGRGTYIIEVAINDYKNKNGKSSGFFRKLLCLQELRGDVTVYLDSETPSFFRCKLPVPENLPFNDIYPGIDPAQTENIISSLKSLVSLWNPDIDENLSRHLSEVGAGVFDLLAVMDTLPDEEFNILKNLLRLVDPKGLAIVSPDKVVEHVRRALDQRRRIQQSRKGPVYGNELFRDFVINPQFQDFPPFWFPKRLNVSINFTELTKKALQMSRTVTYIQPEFFSSPFTLENVMQYKVSHSHREFLISLGALFRLYGVATKYDDVTERLLVHNGREWQVFDYKALSPTKALIPLEVPGEVVIRLTGEEGFCPVSNRPSYGIDFSFTKLDAEKRIFVKNPMVVWNETDCAFYVKLFPGTYEFVVGRKIFSGDGKSEYPSEIEIFLKWIDIKSDEQIFILYPF